MTDDSAGDAPEGDDRGHVAPTGADGGTSDGSDGAEGTRTDRGDQASRSLDEATLPDGWRLWSDDDARAVLVFRPDIFDGGEFPAPCLPTIYVTHGRRNRRPGVEREAPPGASWVITLYLEPEVAAPEELFDSRAAALEAARDLAARFAQGDVDYRDLYQVPRENYFERLDELTG
jgi:hypothetical protein